MSTTDQVARSALGSLNSDADFLLACTWANERYQQIVSRVRFKHLRRIGEFVAPGIVSTGTVSITQNTNLVTGVGTAFDPAHVGRHFRSGNSWYRIASVNSPLSLTLESLYTEATLAAASFTIAARFITLAGRWLGNTIVMARTGQALTAVPLESLDLNAPGRVLRNAAQPSAWAEVGSAIDSEGKDRKLIEVYPALTASELFSYVYYDLPRDIQDPKAVIPPEIDLYVLKEGVLIDVMRRKMAKAADEGKVEVAAIYRNESRAQMTSWEKCIIDAIKADKGVDDATLVMASMHTRYPTDIVNARDEIAARGNFP